MVWKALHSGWATIFATSSKFSDTKLKPLRLLSLLCVEIRLRHCSSRTKEGYAGWARCFILFHGKRHSKDLGVEEFTQFLSRLATGWQASAVTQNQAKRRLAPARQGRGIRAPRNHGARRQEP